jgi:photosystem II stability/assembly factor-like uncharacterized protein
MTRSVYVLVRAGVLAFLCAATPLADRPRLQAQSSAQQRGREQPATRPPDTEQPATPPPATTQPATPPPSWAPPPVEAFKALKYRSIGPAYGGRVSRVAGVPGEPIVYAATASGGVWKSVDGGLTWKPIFDDQSVSSIGSIAVSASDPNIVYVGSGEANIRGNVAAGNGIYKSVDGGKTWTHVWVQEGQIGTMAVHPGNPAIAFAAVLGDAFAANPERGVYRTRDGGRTWQQVLKKNPDTGASDVALDPHNPDTVFAGLWQTRRYPWSLTSGGPGSGLYVSRDGGDTWHELRGDGLPEGIWGKVGVAVAPSDSRRVYALIEAEEGGLFRSDDGGETWTRASRDRKVRQRPWYYSTLTINPTNPDDVWFPQVPMVRTIDGGRTLKVVTGFRHGDHHDVWIDPKNPRRLIDANDAGVEISNDGGETWAPVLLPIGQFYHVSVDSRVPYRVAGALQDIGTVQGPSNSLTTAGITFGDWYGVGGGEAGHVVSKPDEPDIVYAGEYLGYISRYDHRTRQARNVSAYPENGSGHGAADLKYRFQWTAPIAVSPHDPQVVYHGGNVVFRTVDGGQTWAPISGDLTRNDRSRQEWSGGPITGDNTGVEYFCTVFAIAESPVQRGVIWAGSDDGLVHVTRDNGATWTNVTNAMSGLPEWATVSIIEPSPFDAATAYVVIDAHRLDDTHPYLFKTTDFGKHWKRIDDALPKNVYLHAVREDPKKRGQLYVGTERGVVYSTDDGETWRSLQLNLPTVAVHDLVVKNDALILGTHGRSFWILDDLVAIRAFTPQLAQQDLVLLPAADAIRWRYSYAPRQKGAGDNPPRGALMYYFLKAQPKGELVIEIPDDQSHVVRRLSSIPEPAEDDEDEDEDETPDARKKKALQVAAGIQRAAWDLAWQGATKIRRAKVDAGDPERGPLALPGQYTVRLTVDGKTATTTLHVVSDPRSTVSEADLKAQHEFAIRVRDDITRLSGLVQQLRSIREQVQSRRSALKGREGMSQLSSLADHLVTRCDELEARLHNPKAEITYDILAMRGGAQLYSRLSPLLDYATDSDGLPPKGLQEVYATQHAELERLAADVQSLVATDLTALNEAAKKASVPFVVPTTR